MNVQMVAEYRDQEAVLMSGSVRLFEHGREHGVSKSKCGEDVPIISQCRLIRNSLALPGCRHSGYPVVSGPARTHHHFTFLVFGRIDAIREVWVAGRGLPCLTALA